MAATVTLIPGDGTGPEVSRATVRLLAAAGAEIAWEEIEAKPIVGLRQEDTDADPVVRAIMRTRVGLKGPLATPVGTGHRSINVALRKALDLYANFRPVKRLPGIVTPFEGVDLIVVRENTEDLYAGLEHTVVPGVVESLKIITEKASTRIAIFAFEYAQKHGRKKVHAIHKANIMKLSDGLFLNSVRNVARNFPEIEYKELIVDNTCTQLVMKSDQFEVLVLPNLYGDVVSDLAAGLVGGLGVVPSGNIGKEAAIFEAVHGTAPDIAGRGIANPTAIIMSGIMMLDYLDEGAAARRIEHALQAVYQQGKILTADIGGHATTMQFTDAVIAAMSKA